MLRPDKRSLLFRDVEIETYYPSETMPYLASEASSNYNSRKLFNYSYTNFKDLFSYSRSTTIEKMNRITSASNLKIAAQSSELVKNFQVIKQISNNTHHMNLSEANIFLRSYKSIFNSMEDEFHWSNADYFLVPLKGGGVITELFSSLSKEKVVKIDCKRVPLENKEGSYGFGMHIPPQVHSTTVTEADSFMTTNFNGKKITILELCVASGITSIGFLLDLFHKNIHPSEITILSTVMAQQGFEISSEFANTLGLNLNFVTGNLAYSLKDHYSYEYDPIIYDNGDLVLVSPYDAFKMVYNTKKLTG